MVRFLKRFFKNEILLLLFCGSVTSIYSEQTMEKILAPLIIENLKNTHFDPPKINDEFSRDLFDTYIENMDYDKKFFLLSDIMKLKKYNNKIDNELLSQKNEFFTLSKSLKKQRFEEAKEYYKKILSMPFDYSIRDSIVIDPEHRKYKKTKNELKTRWKKLLKYRCLLKYVDLIEEQEKKEKDTTTVPDTVKLVIKTKKELEVDARNKVKKNYDSWFKRMAQNTELDRLSLFVNSMTSLYDPHTNYFPPKQKENFDINMTGQLEGIGAQLKEKDGYIEIVKIIPGSASHRQGELEAGDKIVAVAQGSGEPEDIVDVPLSNAVQLIRGKKGTEVRLTIKKVNGVKKIVSIIRDVVIIEETYAKSLRFEYKNELNIGYIKLPKFYADFNRQGARNCSKDVEIEIEKLKKEKINGLIIDLRNNSGGSLRDVVEMGGLFIKTGGIVQVKAKTGRPKILNDRDPRIQYTGPLIILINHYSASASEILAAAIQDYNRGIVVGTCKSSFGKGTVQTFFDLNRYVRSPFIKNSDFGALKVTTQKFYRINGGATQKKGVIPDIILPDIFMHLDMGEKEQDHVIEWSKIAPINYKKLKQKYKMKNIKAKSEKRTSGNKLFNLVNERGLKIKKNRDKKKYSLVYADIVKERKEAEAESKVLDSMKSTLDELKIVNLKEDKKSISDSLKIEINKKWLEELEKDSYIHETIMIMKDMM